jgi:hypothetical protein
MKRLSKGRMEFEPPGAIMTLGVPFDEIEKQINAAGFKVVPS